MQTLNSKSLHLFLSMVWKTIKMLKLKLGILIRL